MSDVSTAMSTANLSYPSGDAVSGKLELSVSTSLEHETIEALKEVPITTSSGKIVYLEDIARVYEAEESRGGISRYNGQDTMSGTARTAFSAPLRMWPLPWCWQP